MRNTKADNEAFKVLGVGQEASGLEIKKAFRRLAKKYHPDSNNHNPRLAERFKELAKAYKVAIAVQRERALASIEASEGAFGFGRLFRPSAEKCFFPNPTHGKKIETTVLISFDDALYGTSAEVKVPAFVQCSQCHGKGSEKPSNFFSCPKCQGAGSILEGDGGYLSRAICQKCLGHGRVLKKCGKCSGEGRHEGEKSFHVPIPAGIDDGNTIPAPGGGHNGAMGGPPGDLYVTVRVEKSDTFLRKGMDIYCEIRAPFTMGVFGGKVVAPTINGDVLVTVPAGLRANTLLRLKGRGVNGKGNQLVRMVWELPSKLSSREEALLKDFAALHGYPVPASESQSPWARLGGLFKRS